MDARAVSLQRALVPSLVLAAGCLSTARHLSLGNHLGYPDLKNTGNHLGYPALWNRLGVRSFAGHLSSSDDPLAKGSPPAPPFLQG